MLKFAVYKNSLFRAVKTGKACYFSFFCVHSKMICKTLPSCHMSKR